VRRPERKWGSVRRWGDVLHLETMSVARWSVSVIAVLGIAAAGLAGATIWLLVTDPVRGADAVAAFTAGDVTPFVQALGSVILQALRELFGYL
jgi:hypothetical protein